MNSQGTIGDHTHCFDKLWANMNIQCIHLYSIYYTFILWFSSKYMLPFIAIILSISKNMSCLHNQMLWLYPQNLFSAYQKNMSCLHNQMLWLYPQNQSTKQIKVDFLFLYLLSTVVTYVKIMFRQLLILQIHFDLLQEYYFLQGIYI